MAGLLLMMLATACTPSALPPPAAPTQTPGPYDGTWDGTATAGNGAQIHLVFRISASAITWLSYTYPGQSSAVCTALIPPESLPALTGSSFTVQVASLASADTETIRAQFASPTSAAGRITFVAVDTAGATKCAADIDASWTATRRAQTAAAAPAPSAWCGQNVNCRDLLVQLLIFGLVNGAILSLNAIGVTVIYSTVRTINLAHGDVFALTTVLITSSINVIGINLAWSAGARTFGLGCVLLGAIVFGALLSVGVEQAAFRPFRGRSRLAPVIASLGLSFILYQGSLVWRAYQASFVRGEHRSVPGLNEVPTDGIPNFLPQGNLLAGKVVLQFGDVFALLAAVVLVALVTWILLRTDLGRSIRAVAQNAELAQIVGVDPERAIRRAFALGGALAGAAAFVFALYYSRPFGQAGAESGLFAFAAALLGGIGSPLGALASSLLLEGAGAFSDYFWSAGWTPVLVLGILLVLLLVRQGGLFGADEGPEDSGARDSVVLTAPSAGPSARPWLIVLFAALAVLPILSEQFNWGAEILLRGAGIFLLLTLGLNILLGLSGVLDLGYAMSYAVGAYTAAILTSRYASFDFSLVLLASAVTGALFGMLKGLLAARMRGDYLAVGTLALGLMTQQVIVGLDFTGGPNGFSNLPRPHLLGLTVAAAPAQYYLVLVIVLAAAFASSRLIASRTGRAWVAASEDETAAVAFGIDAGRYRLLGFLFSSALAGMAGALYANTFTYIDPSLAGFDISALLLAMVILGGAGSVGGAVLGTALVYFYDKLFVPQLFAWISVLWPQGVYIGMVPNLRGTNFFNFGIVLYLTVLWRARRKPAR